MKKKKAIWIIHNIHTYAIYQVYWPVRDLSRDTWHVLVNKESPQILLLLL